MRPLITNFCYRPELDGLRAVAVIAVLLFHAELGVPGGYTGVDVFFVLSGYLITSIIVKEVQAGTFSFAAFWERRARRILPASIAMMLATLAAGWLLLLPIDYSKLSLTALWQAAFSGNIHFWRRINYFEGPAEEMPLLHMWSLAVEEQYYFAFPFAMYAIFFLKTSHRRAILVATLSLTLLASFTLSTYLVPRLPEAGFFLLPSRAWEMLCGSLIAVLPPLRSRRSMILNEVTAWLGLSAIAASCFTYSPTTPFPGLAAVLPCFGAAMFIWSTTPSDQGPSTTSAAKLLSNPNLVGIGLISYSLYLWHWPLFAFANYWRSSPLTLASSISLVFASVALAIISTKYIESPYRTRKLAPTRKSMFAHAAAGIASLLAVAITIRIANGFPERYPSHVVEVAATAVEKRSPEATPAEIANGKFVRIGNPEQDAPVAIFLWGDSHARALIPAIAKLSEELGIAAEAATYSSTAPVLDFPQTSRHGLKGSDAIAWNDAVYTHIRKSQIPNVILAARWSTRIVDNHEDLEGFQKDDHISQALRATIDRLTDLGTNVWLCNEAPDHKHSVPKTLALHLAHPEAVAEPFVTEHHYHQQSQSFNKLVGTLTDERVRIIDLAGELKAVNKNGYIASSGQTSLYYDSHHLSAAGAVQTLPAFNELRHQLQQSVATPTAHRIHQSYQTLHSDATPLFRDNQR